MRHVFVDNQSHYTESYTRRCALERMYISVKGNVYCNYETGLTVLIETQLLLWRVSSSGIWRRVVCWVATDVSEEHIASIFRVEEIISAKSVVCWVATDPCWNYFFDPEEGDVPPKRRLQLNRLHGVTSQKMILYVYLCLCNSVSVLLIVYLLSIKMNCILNAWPCLLILPWNHFHFELTTSTPIHLTCLFASFLSGEKDDTLAATREQKTWLKPQHNAIISSIRYRKYIDHFLWPNPIIVPCLTGKRLRWLD
jgi:hypothetical protein